MSDTGIRAHTQNLLLAGGAGVLTLVLLQLVVRWGQFIPQPNPSWDYVVGMIWAIMLGASIMFWPVPYHARLAVLAMWVARTAVTLGAMLAYEGNYPSLDGYTYFGAAIANGFDAGQLGFGSGTNNMLQLAALHYLILPDSYHALKVSFAFGGLLAIYAFYRAAVLLMGREDLRVFFLLGLFPSVIFWSSILGKEPVVLLGTALYALGVIGWFVTARKRYLAILLLGITLAGFIRIWSIPILLLPVAVPLIASVQGRMRKLALLSGVAVASVLAISMLANRFVIASTADLLSATELWSQAWAVGGSARTIDVDFTSISSVVAFVPRGAFAALFRPLPGEVMNPFGLVAGAENLLLLALFLIALFRMKLRAMLKPLALWALLLIVIWASVYGLFSYQNLGTAARFKVQILPVLLGLLTYMIRPRWLENGTNEAH